MQVYGGSNMCFISYGLALKQPFQRFRIFTLTWERKGSPVSLDVFSNWVETKSEMLIINVCICILFICRCIHTTTSYGMFRKHPLATGRFVLCPTWCTQMFHLVCFMFKWNFSMYSCRYYEKFFKASSILTAETAYPLNPKMPCVWRFWSWEFLRWW